MNPVKNRIGGDYARFWYSSRRGVLVALKGDRRTASIFKIKNGALEGLHMNVQLFAASAPKARCSSFAIGDDSIRALDWDHQGIRFGTGQPTPFASKRFFRSKDGSGWHTKAGGEDMAVEVVPRCEVMQREMGMQGDHQVVDLGDNTLAMIGFAGEILILRYGLYSISARKDAVKSAVQSTLLLLTGSEAAEKLATDLVKSDLRRPNRALLKRLHEAAATHCGPRVGKSVKRRRMRM